MSVYLQIQEKIKSGSKLFAVLIDPQDTSEHGLIRLIKFSKDAHVDLFMIGGSHVHKDKVANIVEMIKSHTDIPCILFPGATNQIDGSADALLLLSLISGRNAEYLIGKHVEAAKQLNAMPIEIIPTGYILVESGGLTSVQYMSQTLPIPRGKTDIAVSTALAGELLGLKLIYLEAGSGAQKSVPKEMINEVRKAISVPLIVGGGIRTANQAKEVMEAGGDIVVIGNIIEENPETIFDMSAVIHAYSQSVSK